MALNAMLGTFHLRSGNIEAGILTFAHAANAARPADAVIATNLANALVQNGDFAAALEVLGEEIAQADPSMQLERLRGFMAQSIQYGHRGL